MATHTKTWVEFTHICIKNPASIALGYRIARVAKTEAEAWYFVRMLNQHGSHPLEAVKDLQEGAIFTTMLGAKPVQEG